MRSKRNVGKGVHVCPVQRLFNDNQALAKADLSETSKLLDPRNLIARKRQSIVDRLSRKPKGVLEL